MWIAYRARERLRRPERWTRAAYSGSIFVYLEVFGECKNIISSAYMIRAESAGRAAANASGRIARTGWTATAANGRKTAKYSELTW